MNHPRFLSFTMDLIPTKKVCKRLNRGFKKFTCRSFSRNFQRTYKNKNPAKIKKVQNQGDSMNPIFWPKPGLLLINWLNTSICKKSVIKTKIKSSKASVAGQGRKRDFFSPRQQRATGQFASAWNN